MRPTRIGVAGDIGGLEMGSVIVNEVLWWKFRDFCWEECLNEEGMKMIYILC